MSLLDDRIQQPTHFGPMADADAVGAVGNPACGDVLTVYLKIRDGRIEAASFESIGSVYQLATASVLCECIEGRDLEHATARSPECVTKRLPDLPESKHYLARLAIDALRRAIDRHREGPRPPAEDLAELALEDAAAFVTTLLRARPLATLEVEAMAEAEGYHLPGGAARCLSRLRQEGTIMSAMSQDRSSWRWRLTDAPTP